VTLGQAHRDARSLHGRHGSSVCCLWLDDAAGKRTRIVLSRAFTVLESGVRDVHGPGLIWLVPGPHGIQYF
jgi:hypothetical protein